MSQPTIIDNDGNEAPRQQSVDEQTYMQNLVCVLPMLQLDPWTLRYISQTRVRGIPLQTSVTRTEWPVLHVSEVKRDSVCRVHCQIIWTPTRLSPSITHEQISEHGPVVAILAVQVPEQCSLVFWQPTWEELDRKMIPTLPQNVYDDANTLWMLSRAIRLGDMMVGRLRSIYDRGSETRAQGLHQRESHRPHDRSGERGQRRLRRLHTQRTDLLEWLHELVEQVNDDLRHGIYRETRASPDPEQM